jgi:hypothetical protein
VEVRGERACSRDTGLLILGVSNKFRKCDKWVFKSITNELLDDFCGTIVTGIRWATVRITSYTLLPNHDSILLYYGKNILAMVVSVGL